MLQVRIWRFKGVSYGFCLWGPWVVLARKGRRHCSLQSMCSNELTWEWPRRCSYPSLGWWWRCGQNISKCFPQELTHTLFSEETWRIRKHELEWEETISPRKCERASSSTLPGALWQNGQGRNDTWPTPVSLRMCQGRQSFSQHRSQSSFSLSTAMFTGYTYQSIQTGKSSFSRVLFPPEAIKCWAVGQWSRFCKDPSLFPVPSIVCPPHSFLSVPLRL